ncbi:MAG: hypothetical protein NC201_05310 [Prevotella sp.]|nr:hypothetical protein [Bacteroides sp.]MCM1366650.1 hypothetical protein [Prevotella sp.]MCM1437317.1 hypothetical protein [Prevotella sp.]
MTLFETANSLRRKVIVLMAGAAAIILTGCSEKKAEQKPDTDTVKPVAVEDIFHANNDIAMIVRSIADALKQGEELDSVIYNFEGVLTDGSGAALYTNAAGDPGTWRVKVEADKAVIENLDLGSFSPDNVRHYICDEIELNEDDIVKKGVVKGPGGVEMTNYDFDGVGIHFESSKALTAAGKEGPVLSIIILTSPKEETNHSQPATKKK